MATKRRKMAPRYRGLPPDAVAAWQAGDYWALHRALALKPWQMPDWHDDPPETVGYSVSDDLSEVKARLVAVAGPPPRRWRYR